MAVDQNDYREADMTAPAEDAAAMVNATPLTRASRSIFVGTAGNVEAVMRSGATVMFKNVPAGTVLPIRVSQITANTTATDVVALF